MTDVSHAPSSGVPPCHSCQRALYGMGRVGYAVTGGTVSTQPADSEAADDGWILVEKSRQCHPDPDLHGCAT